MKSYVTILTLLVVVLAHANSDQILGSVVTVGNNANACSYTSLTDAINLSNSDEIRVASDKIYEEHIVINDGNTQNLIIRGGYENCTAAGLGIGNGSRAIIEGVNSQQLQPMISIAGNSQQKTVELRHLIIRNGQASGILSASWVDLTLNNVYIGNHKERGLSLSGGNQLVNLQNVNVVLNQRSGLLCTGSQNIVNINNNSRFAYNDSLSSGGGISVLNSCEVNADSSVTIEFNDAMLNGGGVYAASAAHVNLNGTLIQSNTTDDNNQNNSGGGIYATNGGTIVNAPNVKLLNNEAPRGAAMAVTDQAVLTANAVNIPANLCLTIGRCVQIIGNTSPDPSLVGNGAGFFVDDQASIYLAHAYMQGNNARFGALGVVQNDAYANIEGSIMIKNGNNQATYVLETGTGGILDLRDVTIADNESILTQLNTGGDGLIFVQSSIIQNPKGGLTASNGGNSLSFNIECSIISEAQSFGSLPSGVIIDDADFINPDDNNYHIKPTSPAVDFCEGIALINTGYDIDLENRGYDDPNVVDNGLNTHNDAGADEYRWDNDLIFMDGFNNN